MNDMAANDARELPRERGDALGDRMKGYEVAARTSLPRRLPVVVRVDGKAFHTYTRGLKRPFDQGFVDAMDRVALTLCWELEGATLAYVQSDEVSILLHNYRRLKTQPWFDNQVQKTVSVAASIAAATMTAASHNVFGQGAVHPAYFDARIFVLPEAEVANYFLWRQRDASRNSVQMLARSLYSHAECDEKDNAALQEMCFQRGKNWNDLPAHLRRGRCIVRVGEAEGDALRSRWTVERTIPLFSHDRDYIERHLVVDEE
jgi:tRNA(His) 5'-end guanylyltransferase